MALIKILPITISIAFIVRELLFGFSYLPSSGTCVQNNEIDVSRRSAAPSSVVPFQFEFPPEIKRLIINVGSWLDPPLPTGDDVAVIAVEPNLNTAYNVQNEHGHPRMWVITAAISDKAGFANFFTYNAHGASSSLSAMPDTTKSTKPWGYFFSDSLREKGYPPVAFVPVLTLVQLLDAVPKHIQIIGLKTDMQGYDYTAISAAGRALRRVDQIVTEVNCNGEAFNPDAPANDFDHQWVPLMSKLGFKHDKRVACPPEPNEGNALWIRDDFSGQLDEWWHDQKS